MTAKAGAAKATGLAYRRNDGGRKKEGFEDRGNRDCGVRALAIAAGISYQQALKMLKARQDKAPTSGTYCDAMDGAARELGFEYVEIAQFRMRDRWLTKGLGKPMTKDILPAGRLICWAGHHFTAVTDHTVMDRVDCRLTPAGRIRKVKGYWAKARYA